MLSIKGYEIREQLYEGNRTCVYRAVRTLDQVPVVLKLTRSDYPSTRAVARFKHEHDILLSLPSQCTAMCYGLEQHQNRPCLVLEDFGGITLLEAHEPGEISVEAFLDLAIRIVSVLAEIHRRRIIHKDINPRNILLNPHDGEIRIIDFGISTMLSSEEAMPRNPERLEGTLAYIAPEQTGRTNRHLDYRADFYSLGATFYHLLTGELPFPQAQDSLELLHLHIAQTPAPPSQLGAHRPPVLSDIVMKLLAKNAEDRYQSAAGLLSDLRECQRQWAEHESIEPFALAARDVSDAFRISQKLYGRAQQVAVLLETFDRIRDGGCELLLVGGYSGIGKSALVNEVQKSIVESRGFFASGKFEQYRRSVPYGAFIEAFQTLIRQILTRSQSEVLRWRRELLGALDSQAQVIIDVIPDLEFIVGEQPPVAELGPAESQNRFDLVFQRFLQVFGRPEHPLVLFLDDLQWSDIPTLHLLKVLLEAPDNKSVLLIGAYRDNEVDASHPLILTLREIEQAKGINHTILLEPLALEDLVELCIDTLHCGREEVLPLAKLVQAKTHGNPFFVNQLLTALHRRGLVEFDHHGNGWTWDLARIVDTDITQNVVELMSDRLLDLPEQTRLRLQLASCAGARFSLRTLAVIAELSVEKTLEALTPALREGLILPVASADADDDTLEHDVFRFLHDRVQQAAYSLIPEGEKQAVHLHIGRLLLQDVEEGELDEMIFEITGQLNQGAELIEDPKERVQLAELNLRAGRKAKSSTAYGSAIAQLNTGIGLLPADMWDEAPTLCYSLHRELAECEYLSANFERSEVLFEELLGRAESAVDRAEVAHLRHIQYTNTGRVLDALASAREALGQFGITLPSAEDAPAVLEEELAQITVNLGDRAIADLLDAPPATDPGVLISVTLLQDVWVAGYIAGSQPLAGLGTVSSMNLCLRHGNGPESAFVYALYGLHAGSVLGDFRAGHEYGKLALALASRPEGERMQCKAMLIHGAFISCWSDPLEQSYAYLRDGYEVGLKSGDVIYAGYNVELLIKGMTVRGVPLPEVYAAVVGYLPFLRRQGDQNVLELVLEQLNYTLALQGKTDAPFSLSYEDFDEDAHRAKVQAPEMLLWQCWYLPLKLQLLFLQEKYEEAAEWVAVGEQNDMPTTLVGHIQVLSFFFYSGLTMAAYHDEAGPEQRAECRRILDKNRTAIQRWLDHGCHPDVFEHKRLLLEAEQARLDGKVIEAMELYDRAAEAARATGYIQNAAIANHMAARFYVTLGREKVARAYIQEASYLYEQWGASALVDLLAHRYESLLRGALVSRSSASGVSLTTTTDRFSSSLESGFQLTTFGPTIDMAAVLKASQAISHAIQLEQLLPRLMQVLLESAGARRGVLVIEREGELVIEAEGKISEGGAILQATPLESSTTVPVTLIRYAVRTRETVLLNDVSRALEYQDDPYIQGQQPRSVLCIPLVHRDELIGLIYLENDLSTDAFTPDRLEILKVLSAQTAISLENALLYRTLEERVEERTREVRRMQKQLVVQEKLAALGGLAAGIAHEIKNPLNFVYNFADISGSQIEDLREELELGEDPSESLSLLTNNVEKIKEHAKRADGIVAGMLLHAVDLKGQAEPTPLNRLLQDVAVGALSDQKASNSELRVQLETDYDPDVEAVLAVPRQLARAFQNILSNAYYFADLESARPDDDPTVWIRTHNLPQGVEAFIRDNGPGIPPEQQGKVFEPLFTTKPTGSGIGLGLSIAYDIIVHQHRGEMELCSELGAFTEFRVFIPRVRPSPPRGTP